MYRTADERLHHRNRVIANRLRFLRGMGDEPWCPINKLAKRHPYDCGQARCFYCQERYGKRDRRQNNLEIVRSLEAA